MASFQSLKHENYEESTVKIAYHWKGLGEMKFRKRDKIILKGWTNDTWKERQMIWLEAQITGQSGKTWLAEPAITSALTDFIKVTLQ